jgi:hypothetical protein
MIGYSVLTGRRKVSQFSRNAAERRGRRHRVGAASRGGGIAWDRDWHPPAGSFALTGARRCGLCAIVAHHGAVVARGQVPKGKKPPNFSISGTGKGAGTSITMT